MDKDLELLHQKIDFLTEQVMQTQRRQREFDEFKQDITPVLADVFKTAVEELDTLAPYFNYEDLVFLVKKLLRNTKNLVAVLETMENAADFIKDALPLAKPLFQSVLETFNTLEQKGYFTFLLHGARIMDKLVTSFNEEELNKLESNMDSLVRVMKAVSQTDMGPKLDKAATIIEQFDKTDVKTKSLLGLLKDLNSPEIRQVLTNGLYVAKQLAQNNEKH